MRIAALLGLLLLLVILFWPRAGDEVPPVAPSSTTDAGAPVAEPGVGSSGEKASDDVPAGEPEGKLRFRFVTAAEKDAPPVPGAVAAFKAALKRAREAEEALRREMTEGGWLA